jgi:Phytanoyl-CoA dioxygenase (PhyH)
MTPIFTDAFLATPPADIARSLEEDGFFSMQGALTPEFIDEVLKDVANHPFGANQNWVSGVYANQQYYLTHMLACSQVYTDLVTHPKVFEISDTLLGESYRLKAIRYYETFGKHHMQWHTDNKTDRGYEHIPGFICVAYLGDVEDGEFQYVRGTHKWSGDKAYSDYSDEYVEKNLSKDIVSFKAPRGTLLMFDTYGIHRARPVTHRNFVRKSMFFQVDAKVSSAEPLLINPAYLRTTDPKVLRYLGFGQKADYKIYPDTDLNSLPVGRLNLSPVLKWLAMRAARPLYEAIPLDRRAGIKRLFGRWTPSV